MIRHLLALLAILLLPVATAAAGQSGSIAVFAVEFVNTSLEATRADERARLAMLDRELRAALEARGYRLVDTAPVADRAGAYASLRECNGCEIGLARALGADQVALAWVQKVSNLILNITVKITDTASGAVVHAGSVSIRGNTDESWSRGLRYLLKNVVFAERRS